MEKVRGTHKVIFENGLTGVIDTRDLNGNDWHAWYSGWGLLDNNHIGGYQYDTEDKVLDAMRGLIEKGIGWSIKEIKEIK